MCDARLVFCFKNEMRRGVLRLLHENSREEKEKKFAGFFLAYFAFEIEPVNIYRRRPKACILKMKYFQSCLSKNIYILENSKDKCLLKAVDENFHFIV